MHYALVVCFFVLLSTSRSFRLVRVQQQQSVLLSASSDNKEGEGTAELLKYKSRSKLLEEAIKALRVRLEAVENAPPPSIIGGEEKREVQALTERLEEAENKAMLLARELSQEQRRSETMRIGWQKELQALANNQRVQADDASKNKNADQEELQRLRKAQKENEAEMTRLVNSEEWLNGRVGRLEAELDFVLNQQQQQQQSSVESSNSAGISELKKELKQTKELMEVMETEYLAEIKRLEDTIDTLRKEERVKQVQSLSLLENAQRDLAEVRVLLKTKEDAVARLENELSALQDSFDRLGGVGGGGGGGGGGAAAAASSEGGNVGGGAQRTAAVDYLIAGDLRDQRRLLEQQSKLIESLIETIERTITPSASTSTSTAAAAAASARASFTGGNEWRRQVRSGSFDFDEEKQNEDEDRGSVPASSLTEAAAAIFNKPAAKQMRVAVRQRLSRAAYSVWGGLNFLVGLEVPEYDGGGKLSSPESEPERERATLKESYMLPYNAREEE